LRRLLRRFLLLPLPVFENLARIRFALGAHPVVPVVEAVADIIFHHLLRGAPDHVGDPCSGQRGAKAEGAHDQVDRLPVAGSGVAIRLARTVVRQQQSRRG